MKEKVMAKTIWTTPSTLCIGDSVHIDNLWEAVQAIEAPKNSEVAYILHTSSRVVSVGKDVMLEVI